MKTKIVDFLIDHLFHGIGLVAVFALVIFVSYVNSMPKPVLPVAHTQFLVTLECGSGLTAHREFRYTQKLPVCDKNNDCSSLGGPAFTVDLPPRAVGDQMILANANHCLVSATAELHTWSSQHGTTENIDFTDQEQIDKFLALTAGQ